MSARDELTAYLSNVHRRLRVGTLTRGAAAAVVAALTLTVLLVLALETLLFSRTSIQGARWILVAVLACVLCGCVAVPLRRMTRQRAAAAAEARDPRFQQRLVTFTEGGATGPFVELLADDTLALTRNAKLPALATDASVGIWLGVAALAAGTLIWLVAAAPGTLGYGSHLLWTNAVRGAAPVYDIHVKPGDLTIRRYSDQLVAAQPEGIKETQLFLLARYQNNLKWERIAMQSRADRPGYQFTLTAVPANVEYYVQAGTRESPHYHLRVADPPVVRQIRVTYHFPAWTGRADETEEAGGDLHALKGTRADLELTTDRPMADGSLALSNGQTVVLSGGENNHYHASVELQSDGDYHVASLDHGQPVRISEDYFIEARDPSPPTVTIVRPGGDYRASPIEEVNVTLHAADDYGLKHLLLHYAVNGGPEKTIELLDRDGSKQVDGRSVLALENFKLVPGDLVSLYATAADAQLESHTDIAFIQIEPFSRSFSQSQASGGESGSGAGNASGEISQREKEIISATFKQQNDTFGNAQQATETAKLLSEIQTTLRQQSLALSGRLRSRELSDQNSEFGKFQQEMRDAANAMTPAAQQLQRQNWKDAIPEEQKVLQHLLRAEATFREIEIAFGARGGAGSDAGRDLASLFDLELDTEKNQYEAQQRASSADQRAKDIDAALKKLDELARRQQELAERQRDVQSASAEQRWQQEMLKREAEELQQQLEQLAHGSDRPGQPGGSLSQGQGQSQSQTQGTSRAQAARQALDQLRQAQQDMAGAGAGGENAADARRAAQRLKEASNLLGGMQSQEAGQRLEAIAREAERLAGAESEQSARIQRLKERGSNSPTAARDVEKLRDDRQSIADALSALQKNMRDAAREFASGQRSAAEKLRDALKEVDDGDLEPLLQRTADWLRTGMDPNARGTESQIAAGLKRLSEQTRDAQQALNADGEQRGQGVQEALDRVARLRREIENMRGDPSGSPSPADAQGQAGGAQPAGGRQAGGTQQSDARPGVMRPGGGGEGFVDNNLDTGNNARSGARSNASPVSAPAVKDTQARIQQGLGELRALRQQAAEDPEMRRQVQQLIASMEHLDPKRFPGNPQMLEQIQQQLLGDVDTLDLQLRRNLADTQAEEIRSPDPALVPRGYEDAVADYFRRLGDEPARPASK